MVKHSLVTAAAQARGSNSGIGIWQGSGHPSKVVAFPPGSPVSSTTLDHIRQHPRLQEHVYKFHDLSV